ncbi:MAG: hypothetical protein WCB76_19245 [Acidobacteriaceae bacterium]|jgi:hypothetical protein
MRTAGEAVPNGAAAAAMLAAGLGCFVLGVVAVAGDGSRAVARLLTFYRPTGPLSGVTTTAIVCWLVAWAAWHRAWRGRTVGLGRISAVAWVLLGMGLLLTFPPLGDLLLGR